MSGVEPDNRAESARSGEMFWSSQFFFLYQQPQMRFRGSLIWDVYRDRDVGLVCLPTPAGSSLLGMVHITGAYESGLRCHVTHGPSGSTFFTDAPVDNHGQGRSFSPTDLVATALGACMMTIMGIWAERQNISLAGSRFEVTKEMSTTPPRKIAKLTVRFDIPTKLSDEQKQRLEQAARACPVHHSLHPDVACEITFNWA
jgi:putative redox protein